MKRIIAIVLTVFSLMSLTACSTTTQGDKSGAYFEGHYVIDAVPIGEISYFTDIYIFEDGVSYMYTNYNPEKCAVYDYSYSKDMGYIGFGFGYMAKISDDLKTITFENYTLTKQE